MLVYDATMELLDCIFCFHFLVSKDTTKVGLMLQAIKLRVVYENLQVVYGIYTTCFDQSDHSICYNYDLSVVKSRGCSVYV